MSSYHYWPVPGCYKTWYIFDHYRFTEDSAIKNITDGTIWTLPHLLQFEFFHTVFIRSDGCAFDAYTILADGVCCIYSHLVIGFVAVLHSKVKIFDVDVEVGQDQLI